MLPVLPRLNRRALLVWALAGGAGLALPVSSVNAKNDSAPALMLAQVYREGMPLDGYWVSEKYDGVRGYWDGKQFWTRGGERVNAPAWFTARLPEVPLDGELWGGRGRFQFTASVVRSRKPSDRDWREMHFMVFDLPAAPGDFDARLIAMKKLLPVTEAPWVLPVPQERATTHEALQRLLDKTVKLGGEGLMLHRGSAPYRAERNADLLKFKPYEDADARVLAHLPGRGQFAGMTGALWVETAEGQRFRLGSGLTQAQRRKPPPIGSWISYRFNGRTDAGLPRFARFLRVRSDRNP